MPTPVRILVVLLQAWQGMPFARSRRRPPSRSRSKTKVTPQWERALDKINKYADNVQATTAASGDLVRELARVGAEFGLTTNQVITATDVVLDRSIPAQRAPLDMTRISVYDLRTNMHFTLKTRKIPLTGLAPRGKGVSWGFARPLPNGDPPCSTSSPLSAA